MDPAFSLDAEDTLWTGTPGDYADPDAPITLSRVRKLVDDGQFAEATAVAANLSGTPSDVSCCLTSIFKDFAIHVDCSVFLMLDLVRTNALGLI